VTWGVDFTTRARSDLVGLQAEVNEAIIDLLVVWIEVGPPREAGRAIIGVEFHEVTVSDRYLMAYSVDEDRARFVVLWIRPKPGAAR
jgi:hypothetical protein